MIHLDDKLHIGEGEIRFCYEHPNRNDLCIKIPRPETTREYTLKELIYFKKLSKRNKSNYDYQFFSDFHGEVETNMGLGQVFDLVRDEITGNVSKTLEYYLEKDDIIKVGKIREALHHLKTQMISHRIFARDLRTRNICCQLKKDDSIKLIIIDGIGHRDFFPFAEWLTHFAEKKVERAFQKFHLNSI